MKNGDIDCNNIVFCCKFFHSFTDDLNVSTRESKTINNSLNNNTANAVCYCINTNSLVINNSYGNTTCNRFKCTCEEIVTTCCINTIKKRCACITHFPFSTVSNFSIKSFFTGVEMFGNIFLLIYPLVFISGPVSVQVCKNKSNKFINKLVEKVFDVEVFDVDIFDVDIIERNICCTNGNCNYRKSKNK